MWVQIRDAGKPKPVTERAAARKLYALSRAAFLTVNRWCAVALALGGPKKTANQVHHTRGRLGTLLIDQRYWKGVSAAGHRWIDEHREEARDLGLLCERGDWHRIPQDAETQRLKRMIEAMMNLHERKSP